MGQGEPQGLNPGAWSPLESLTPLTPSPSPVAISSQPTEQRGRPVASPIAMSCGGTWPNGSPLWGICHRRWCWLVVSVFYFSKVPRDSDIRSVTHSTVGLLGSCCSCLSTLSFLSDNDSSANQSQHGLTHAFSCPSIYSTNNTGPFHLAQCQALQQSQNWKGQSTNYSIYGLGCWVRRK